MTANQQSGRTDGRTTLTLTRRAGEGFWIGPDVHVTYAPVGSSPRLGIEAPRDMPIVRASILSQSDQDGEAIAGGEAQAGPPCYTDCAGYLVLGMSRGESAVIGRPGLDYDVSVLRVSGGTARITVTAPAEVTILRDELVDDRAA
ncbi:carbon storage regulator [Thioalkalivibrio thiocyanoxidans]|uniref:carbon storage regulator n=1 Tax=Thioalkalivibrio thiocyanoxidans TaxID=152475 RepID=UPI000368F701|nr:carbon storage regulator [Thioalkalivibrio thiocyanoxidans]